MKIVWSKKNIFFVIIISLILILLVVGIIYLVNKKKYPEEPLEANNLGKSNVTVNISDMKREGEGKDIPVYSVLMKVHVSNIEELISKLGLVLKKEEIEKDTSIKWSDGKSTFSYNSLEDVLNFQLGEGISMAKGVDGFSELFNRYLGWEYKFVLNKEHRDLDGGTTYYASRVLGDIPIQFSYAYEYTDVLKFDKNGKLVSASLLLAEIEEYDFFLPLIDRKELETYINLKEYPKEHYVDTSVLVETLDLHYLDDSWTEIEESVTGCIADKSEVILLYKDTNQGYLLPVFKISSTCKVYKDDLEYSVPALFYVNGVNPRYIAL
ncbi:MAG: hypothetical protein ACOX0X_01300 [Candidatus Dojkabacteria bacterium]